MRGFIPFNIFTLEDRLDCLLADGVPSVLCQRVLTEQGLWLLCMHSEDLRKVCALLYAHTNCSIKT